ncbi:hypothetical protein INT47_001297 [Mucor saturninus]|uniref:Uncharacterized protein n=1 Tax=Mucor saturninus TaxID=64648 RepID=A0A8H7V8G3_9FUNG|nr:hypothetical protein INT47_001297 [Mucor saturninus]
MIQICDNQCDVTNLNLGDIGLYCIDEFLDLTLPLSPAEFAEDSPSWFQKLFTLRSMVFNPIHLIDEREDKKSDTSHFSRLPKQQDEKISYSTWIRGSFYPPTSQDNSLYISQDLYDIPAESSKKKE